MQRQKLTEHALYQKNSAAMFIVLYGQLHSEFITIVFFSLNIIFIKVLYINY